MNSKYQYLDFRILIFCKSPEPGTVKTRLISDLGELQSASLAEELATARIEMAVASGLAPVQLWCHPTIDRPFFQLFAGEVELKQQSGADLGERMHAGFENVLSDPGVKAAILIGTDCPLLDGNYLEQAIGALQHKSAVIGPAEDGGYGLIGLRASEAALFSDIQWSTESVLAETVRRFEKYRPDWVALPQIWDVDRPEDVVRYRRFLATGKDISVADEALLSPE